MGYYKIIKLEPKDYYKCANIWNTAKNPDRTKKWYDELVDGNRITFVYTENVTGDGLTHSSTPFGSSM